MDGDVKKEMGRSICMDIDEEVREKEREEG